MVLLLPCLFDVFVWHDSRAAILPPPLHVWWCSVGMRRQTPSWCLDGQCSCFFPSQLLPLSAVVFCGDEEADSFLVREAERKLVTGHSRVVIATNDGMPALSVTDLTCVGRNQLTLAIEPERLVQSMEAAERRLAKVTADVEAGGVLAAAPTLEARAAARPDVRAQLGDLRMRLWEEEERQRQAEAERKRREKREKEEATRQLRIAQMLEWQAREAKRKQQEEEQQAAQQQQQ